MECEIDEHFLSKNYSCYVKPINRTIAFLNLQFYVVPVVRDLVISFQLLKKETAHFRPFLVSFKDDFCHFLNTKQNANILVKLVLNYFLPYSNIKRCPIQGNIVFENFYFSPDFMPSVWPKGYYKAAILMYADKRTKPALSMNVYFELEEKNRANN